MNKQIKGMFMHNTDYEKWFREQVRAALDDTASGIKNEDVKQKFSAMRAILQRRIASVGTISET